MTYKTKLAFLDVDGVLNCGKCAVPRYRDITGEDPCDHDTAVVNLLKGRLVYISSTWRLYTDSKANVIKWLAKHNLTYTGITPTQHEGRGLQIIKVLGLYADAGDIVTDFIVLDDDSFDITPYIPTDKFIHFNKGRIR